MMRRSPAGGTSRVRGPRSMRSCCRNVPRAGRWRPRPGANWPGITPISRRPTGRSAGCWRAAGGNDGRGVHLRPWRHARAARAVPQRLAARGKRARAAAGARGATRPDAGFGVRGSGSGERSDDRFHCLIFHGGRSSGRNPESRARNPRPKCNGFPCPAWCGCRINAIAFGAACARATRKLVLNGGRRAVVVFPPRRGSRERSTTWRAIPAAAEEMARPAAAGALIASPAGRINRRSSRGKVAADGGAASTSSLSGLVR